MENKKKPIELYENTNQLMNASIDKITVELINKRNEQGTSQVILLSGCSPLAGTTSISISLAIAMAATDRKTVLIDCDVRKSGKYKKLNDDVKVGLANYLLNKDLGKKKVEDIVYDTNIHNLKYIPCGDSDENPTRTLCSNRFDELLTEIRDAYDCILLDCPSFSVVPDAQIMFGKVDGIVFVSALGMTKKSHIKDARRIIAPYIDRYYGMIINKVPKDIFKANVKNSDYYLLNRDGNQRFENARAYRRLRKTQDELEKKSEEEYEEENN